jgi:hypothetical protein
MGARVYYLCNWNRHSGGIKVLYDHVRCLRRLDYDARLAAYGRFRRCTWFASDPSDTPDVSHVLERLRPDDIVVLPEICMWDDELGSVDARQIVFVQNPDLMTGDANDSRYEAVVVPSRPLVDWVRHEKGYRGPLLCVPGFLETDLITARRTTRPSNPRVLIVSRNDKHRGEPLRARAALERAGLPVTYVDERMDRTRFVALFRRHDVYLHLSYREGFPVSILEAFGAGCLVVGFAGRGGLEFMRDGDNCHVVADGDWAAAVSRTLELRDASLAIWTEMRSRARATAREYPRQRSERALAGVFAQIVVGRC